ncbi:GNAT family N-acetyltransferase [Kitasatospora sp. NPDC005856]|uniref:GNAT family N-acetyltransferase n=1 Tax=Kitasatospora sp. NPDC005856 TaxID=3154566 RepID=UPI0033F77B41
MTVGERALTMLMVAPGARRRGVGELLLDAVESTCTTPKSFTSTNVSNQPVQRLLQRVGWHTVGLLHGLDDGDPELFFLRPRTRRGAPAGRAAGQRASAPSAWITSGWAGLPTWRSLVPAERAGTAMSKSPASQEPVPRRSRTPARSRTTGAARTRRRSGQTPPGGRHPVSVNPSVRCTPGRVHGAEFVAGAGPAV